MTTTLANISIKDSSSWNTLLDLIYPVGSVYLSNNNKSPSSMLGGTWSSITSGRYLRFLNSSDTGGANTITVKNLPAHKHTIIHNWGWRPLTNTIDNGQCLMADQSGDEKYTATSDSTGGGEKYYPAYQSFYCWYRTK